ncbi:hypothetical protein GF312_03800 [Candidatus Poribacteria bacterium]|nr:hypothetical protein [Candidatus Poribacteria bacterium]
MLKKLVFSISALMVMALTVNAQEFVTDGLILMYTFDSGDVSGDTVADVSGTGNDGTAMGTVNYTSGMIGDALMLDGTDGYIEIPAMGSFEQVSVECWVYEEAFAGIQGIVSTWQWEAGKVHYKFESNQIQVDKNGAGKITADAEAQTWYHVVYTTDTIGDALKLYVDGELAADGPGGAGVNELWDERRVGSEHDGRFLNGMVDEVRVYDRVLSADEVVNNFAVTTNVMTAVKPSGKAATTWGSIKL